MGDDGAPLAGVDVRLASCAFVLALDAAGALEVERPERVVVTGEGGEFVFAEWVFRDPGDDEWDEDDDWDDDDAEAEGDEEWANGWRDDPWALFLRRGEDYAIRERIDLLDGPVDVGDVVFRPSDVRRFRVVADDGTTIAGGRLSVGFQARSPHQGRQWTLALDDCGAACAPLFDEALDAVLLWTLHHPDHPEKCERVPDWRGPAGEPLVLVAERGCRVLGRVLDDQGRPAADVWVKVVSDAAAITDLASLWTVPRTAADGRFEVTCAADGASSIQLLDGGARGAVRDEPPLSALWPSGTPLARVRVPASERGAIVDLGDVRVTLEGSEAHGRETGEIRLRVLDRDGVPLQAAIVSVHPIPAAAGVAFAGLPTDPEGRVTFGRLSPGSYGAHVQVAVDGVECSHRIRDLRPGPDETDIVATGAGHVFIELIAAEAPDARTVFRQIEVEDSTDAVGVFSSKGDHVVHHAEPGRTAHLIVRAMGREPVTLRDVEVLADRPTRVRAVLSRSP